MLVANYSRRYRYGPPSWNLRSRPMDEKFFATRPYHCRNEDNYWNRLFTAFWSGISALGMSWIQWLTKNFTKPSWGSRDEPVSLEWVPMLSGRARMPAFWRSSNSQTHRKCFISRDWPSTPLRSILGRTYFGYSLGLNGHGWNRSMLAYPGCMNNCTTAPSSHNYMNWKKHG